MSKTDKRSGIQGKRKGQGERRKGIESKKGGKKSPCVKEEE